VLVVLSHLITPFMLPAISGSGLIGLHG
jgi:hypothetical protein